MIFPSPSTPFIVYYDTIPALTSLNYFTEKHKMRETTKCEYDILPLVKRPKKLQILVILPTMQHTERLKLKGILSYAREHAKSRWQLHLDLEGISLRPNKRHSLLPFDGILAYAETPDTRRRILSSRRPTVLFDPSATPGHRIRPGTRNILFVNNHQTEGETAAHYFLDRHFADLAYIDANERTPWGDRRAEGFRTTARAAGCRCHIYPRAAHTDVAIEQELPNLVQWLKSLPKPCGLYAVHDLRARHVLLAAHEAGIGVPDELSVLGTDNDEIICETASPDLSSIDSEDERLGRDMAKALDELLAGRRRGGESVTHHRHVVERVSTEANAIADPFVAQAIRYARAHLSENPGTSAIARHIGYSPRLLQFRAKRSLGTTLGVEIRKIRLTSALEMLTASEKSISTIADECGYTGVSHLCMTVKKETGLTPFSYRHLMAARSRPDSGDGRTCIRP